MGTISYDFDEAYGEWMKELLSNETNPRVRSRIEQGLEHGTLEFYAPSGSPL